MKPRHPLTLEVGNLAYIDSFAGFVPCWIMSIVGPSGQASTEQRVTVKVTANRGAYRRGDVVETFGLHVCPRGAARFGKHCTTIRPYNYGQSPEFVPVSNQRNI